VFPINKKPPIKQAAFSLLELVVVLVVIGILAAVALPRFLSRSDVDSRAAAAELVNHLQFAQQLAMNNTRNTIGVVISTSSIDIQSNGVSIRGYPVDIATPYSVTLSPVSLTYTSMGETTATTINVTPSSGVSVCVENSGYAWLC
jgi:prepilin-type N-terminal cleavage/methylation domain-containing protein